MAFSRRLGVIGILGVSWLVAVGCSDDEDKRTNSGDAGEAGEAGAGGKSTAGGSSSTAGKGGNATAGKGGSAGGGGTAGSADAGAPPVVGGEGGMTPIPMGGAAGEAPLGGAAGLANGGASGSPAQLLSCAYECNSDDDCKIGIDDSQKCDPETKRCKDPNLSCTAGNDCVPSASFWFTPGCTDSDADCFPGYSCIDFNGSSYCAALPDPDFGCFPYGTLSLPVHGQAATEAEVCIDLDVRCSEAGTCFEGCTATGCDPGSKLGDTCNETSGLCECETGDECATGVCENSHCVACVTSEDCAASAQATGLDTCVAGKCGCSSSEKCPAPDYNGASPLCE